MTPPAAARRWTCSRCGLTVGNVDGSQVPVPDTWDRCVEGDFCLSCRRERAAEAAEAAVAEDGNAQTRAQVRRGGLIEFEVRRTPDLSDNIIARACRTTPGAVAAARKRLGI
jgi:hypothetical protein